MSDHNPAQQSWDSGRTGRGCRMSERKGRAKKKAPFGVCIGGVSVG